jgi:hypothetical protein
MCVWPEIRVSAMRHLIKVKDIADAVGLRVEQVPRHTRDEFARRRAISRCHQDCTELHELTLQWNVGGREREDRRSEGDGEGSAQSSTAVQCL